MLNTREIMLIKNSLQITIRKYLSPFEGPVKLEGQLDNP